MFLTDCHACGLRELRGARSIELLADTDAGPQLVYRCNRCDAVGVLTGDPAPAAPAAAPTAVPTPARSRDALVAA